MATSFVNFKLDFTLHVLKNDLPNYRQALSCYTQTVQGAPVNVIFRSSQKPGVFIIRTNSAKDTKKLENKHVTYSYGKKNEKEVKVKLEKLPKFQLYCDPKWITIDWVQESGLMFAENTVFDNFLSNFGTIIVPTYDDKNELGMLNGRKKVRIDLDKKLSVGRIQQIEAEVVSDEGIKKTIKGKVKMFYPGQPVFCRDCKEDHTEKCHLKIKREETIKEHEKSRKKGIKAFLISDSNMRHVNEQALHANSHVASGAKIGHLANVIKDSDLENINHIIISGGINNIDSNPSVNFDKWHDQQKTQFTKLQQEVKNCSEKGKFTKIIAIPEVPAVKDNNNAVRMRKAINSSLDQIAKTINETYPSSVEVLNINDEMENGIEPYEDELHISAEYTEKILQRIDTSIAGFDLIVKNRPEGETVSVKKIYSRVYSSYPLGCGHCTRVGHSIEKCEFLKKAIKRNASSSNSPDTKKVNRNVSDSKSPEVKNTNIET